MRPTRGALLVLALGALLCVLPTLFSPDSSLVNGAPAARSATTSYTSENRDLEEDDDDAPASSSVVDASGHTVKLRMLGALGGSPFETRGDVVLDFAPPSQKTRARTVAAVQKALTFSGVQSVSKAAARALLASNPSALYRVSFVAEGGVSADQALVASVPLCALVASHWHESFIFHADPYGTVLSVTYRTPISTCTESASTAATTLAGAGTATFVPRGKISFGRPGEKAKLHVRPGFDASAQASAQAVGSDAPPPAAAAPEQPRNADGSVPPPPQTFWQKYWLYIVPLGIFMLVQAFVAPPEEPPKK